MGTVWFILILGMLITYVVLDGFDLGAGALHPFVSRDASDRRTILKAVGPVWDGNEVWLIASGGTMFFAFPVLYAVSFSGFYLPLIMVLWLLMLRGLTIELRSHLHNPLWATFWDGLFFLGSALLALFFGVALGTVVRGVPLGPSGYFFEPLWTDLNPRNPNPGILDWYTVLVGLLAVVVLVAHGANWLALKTTGELNERSRRFSLGAWVAILPLTAATTVTTFWLRPGMLTSFLARPWGFLFPVIAVLGLLGMAFCPWRRLELPAFFSSAAYIAGMMASTAFALYPMVLPSVNAPYSLTIHNAATTAYGMKVGLVWWVIGMCLAVCYFVLVYRQFRGKILPEPAPET